MRTIFALITFSLFFPGFHVTAQDLATVNVEMPPQGFFPAELKDWVIIVGTIATVIGVLFGGWKGLAEWNRSTKQREEELKQRELEFRHKQAVYARETMKEVFSDPKARAALEMLDWSRKRFTTEEGEIVEIRRSQIQLALRAPNQITAQGSTNLKFSRVEAFIRTRFEALYDYVEEIEKLVKLDIINFEDLETVFRYYMIRALRPEIEHFAFLEYYDYPNAKAFLNRFATGANPGSWLSPSELEDDNIAASETPQKGR